MTAVPKIVPISDLRKNAAGLVRAAAASGEPVFITRRGRAAAVMMSTQSYERTQHELEVLGLLARGEVEIEAGAGFDMDDVMSQVDNLLGEM